MKKLYISLLITLSSLAVFSQQDVQFSQFMFDRLSINPAFAGTMDAYCITFMNRNQWQGFGANPPKTFLLNAHAPVPFLKGGLGLTFYNDKLGYFTNNKFKLAYSFHKANLGPGNFAAGLSVGNYSSSYDAQWVTPDGLPASTDASIGDNSNNQGKLDFDFGLYYYDNSKFYIGASFTHLTNANLDKLNVLTKRHFYLMGGYTHEIPSIDLAIKPNFLVKSDMTKTQYDLNLNVMFKNLVWAGISYRGQDAIAPLAGLQYELPSSLGIIKVGYSYDVTTSALKNYSSGTHEIMLNYCFNINVDKPIQKSKHPIFL